MPLQSRLGRLLAGVPAAATILVAVAPAHGASLNVTAQCTFPFVGTQPVSFKATFPEGLEAGDWSPAVIISDIQAPGAAPIAERLEFGRNRSKVDVQVDGASYGGSSHHGGPAPTAGVVSSPVFLNGALPNPPASYGFSLLYPEARTVTATLQGLTLNLRAVTASGGIRIIWQPNDSDGNPETFDAPCVLDEGQALSAAFEVAQRTRPVDTTPPTAPKPVTVSDVTTTTATIGWGASTDDDGVDRYEVTVSQPGGLNTVFQTTSARTASFTALKPATDYEVEVWAIDRGLNASPVASATFTTATPRQDEPFALGLTGAATIAQGRTTGTLPLSGLLEGTLHTDDTVSAGLTLAPTTAEFKLQGALRLTAKATFTPVDATTATLEGGVLKTRSNIDVAFSEARLFGSIPVATGTDCGLANPAALTLTSAAGFTLDAGGTLTGSAALGRLENCGAFGRFVGSDLGTATVQATLAPR